MSYQSDTIPLWNFFQDLRRSGAHLGIDNYELLIEALLNGAPITTRKNLFLLCKTIWYKPDQSFFTFSELFNKYFTAVQSDAPEPAGTDEQPDNDTPTTNWTEPNPEADKEETAPKQEDDPLLEQRTQAENIREVYISVGKGKTAPQQTTFEEAENGKYKFHFMPVYLPMKEREIEQRFHFIREQEAKGATEELDIDASIQVVARHGFLAELQYLPKFSNQATLTVFVDHDGSMVAFHELSDQLMRIVEEQVGIQTERFYFYNLPHDGLLFKNINRTDSILLDEWIKQMQSRKARERGLLIISDAGAARGRFSPERIQETEDLLTELLSVTQKIAWLNPVPEKRWQATSAEAIARKVHMVELSPTGINLAVNILRGMFS